jgi:hypothetical protein
VLTTPPPGWASWQRIINGRDVPDWSSVVVAAVPIPVVARVVWATDGEQWVEGLAIRWTRSLVLVELRDPRCSTVGPWLDASDVKRP